jgi:hypothetical protein
LCLEYSVHDNIDTRTKWIGDGNRPITIINRK